MNVQQTQSDTAIASALRQVRTQIEAAATRSGRPANSVTLVAVSKTHPTPDIVAALAAGQMCFGENRVQEAAEKFPALRPTWPAMSLHLIGGLQTNKAAEAVRIADMIESLDRLRLADAIADAAQKAGRLPRLMVQVNIGDEAQKSGVSSTEADAFVEACQTRFGDHLCGLMCIPPVDTDPAPHFSAMAAMRHRHGLALLSMGMSADYPVAIAHGATHVRVGSAIFGARPNAT